MTQALENPVDEPTYLEFFGLTRPPFARLSQPSEIFNSEQYSLLMSHLTSATKQTDCRVVIFGADGSGKTSLLNRYIGTLDDEISFAAIDETCVDKKQFYIAFLRQLGFKDITGSMHELRRITKEFLINRCMADDPVLLIIDNAHLVSPSVFEQLRWISETKVEGRRVLSVVLAGSSDLMRIIESPAMSTTRFRSHVDFNIRAYTEDETVDYVRHRLKLAGGIDAVKFSNDAHPLVYRYTGGVPGLINTLCNALLTEAHARDSRIITGDLVPTVADSSQLLPHANTLQGKGRRSTDADRQIVAPGQRSEERITERETMPRKSTKKTNKKAAKQTTGKSSKKTARKTTKKSMKKTTGKSAPDAAAPDVEVKDLLDQVAELSDQLGEVKAERKQALADIALRDKDVSEFREQLDSQTKESVKLKRVVAENADKIKHFKQAQSDGKRELQKSKKAERKAIADFNRANKRVAKADALEQNTTDLAKELKEKASQLKSRDEALGDIEKQLQESMDECESLRSSDADLKDLEKSVAEKDARIENLRADLASFGHEATSTQARLPEQQDEPDPPSTGQESVSAKSDDTIATFEIVRNGKIERVIEVSELPSRIMIGRADDSELSLGSEFVSRHHALMFRDSDGIHIEDLNSFNGTFVNHKAITRCNLRPDDDVIIGDYQIRPRQ